MCGITGIIDNSREINKEKFALFTDTLTHRGPDARGLYYHSKCALGHRRLAIIDLNDNVQYPIRYNTPSGKTLVITFNGEIYNYLELRRELVKAGYRFSTKTDTEVILASYDYWGEGCQYRFNGMWAFAIYSEQDESLFLSRDRFGVKPLYYMLDANRVAFASEIKSFAKLDGCHPKLDVDMSVSLVGDCSVSYEASDVTFVKGVKKLRAGHAIRFDRGLKFRVRKWWDTSENLISVPAKYEQQVKGFRDLFFDAVSVRLRSDVPVTTSLSGGVDSSAVVVAVAECAKNGSKFSGLNNHVFTASFPSTSQDEERYARIVADHFGKEIVLCPFSEDVLEQDILNSFYYEDDLVGMPLLPISGNYGNMRQYGYLVSLDGHGADELMAGYTLFKRVPFGKLQDELYRRFHGTQLPAILRNFDRASMQRGVEVRSPLLDYRIVCYTFSLPATSICYAGQTKRILRDAIKGLIPNEIRLRKSKIGFRTPMGYWMDTILATLIQDILKHPLYRDMPFVTKEFSDKIVGHNERKDWHRQSIQYCSNNWKLLTTVLWRLIYEEQDPRFMPECLKNG